MPLHKSFYITIGLLVGLVIAVGIVAYSTRAEAATPPATVPQGGTGWGAVGLGNLLFGQGTSLPGSLRLGTSSGLTFSTTTGNLTFNYGSTTALSVSGLTSGNCVQAGTGGLLTTTGGACATAAAFPFTPTTNFATAVNSTSTPIWFVAGLMASSTSRLSTTTVYTQDDDGFAVIGAASNHLGLFQSTDTGASHISFCNTTTGCTATDGVDIGMRSTANGNTGIIRNREAAGLDFLVNTNYNALNIGSSGNVGFSTTTPFAKLSVSLNSTDTAYPGNNAFLIASSTASATTTLFSISNVGSTTMGRFGTCSGTSALTTNSSGIIVCGTGYGSGTVTSITAGTGLSGGTITNTGTITLTSYLATSTAETSGRIPYWASTAGTPAQLNGGSSGLTFDGTKLTATYASTTVFTAGGTTFYVDSAGKITGKDVSKGFSGIVSPVKQLVLSIATSTGTWTATSTPGVDSSPTYSMPFNGTIQDIRCKFNAFLGVNIQKNGSSISPSYFIASTTVGTTTSGTTFVQGDSINIYAGTTTSATASSGVVNGSCYLDVTQDS